MNLSSLDQFSHYGRHAACAVIILAKIFACGLQVDEQWQVIAVGFPILD